MITIQTEVGRKLRNRETGLPNVAAVEASMAAQIARYLGGAIRARVQGTGDLAGQAWPGWSERGGKYTSTRYPDKATGKQLGSGAEVFKNSLVYHRAAGSLPGSYSVTGGMWAGLSAVVQSTVRSLITFRGRSDGQDPRWLNGKSRPIKVNNALKAWTVFEKHKVNVLRTTAQEMAAVTEAVTISIGAAVGRELDVEWSGPTMDIDFSGPQGAPAAVFAAVFGRLPVHQFAALQEAFGGE